MDLSLDRATLDSRALDILREVILETILNKDLVLLMLGLALTRAVALGHILEVMDNHTLEVTVNPSQASGEIRMVDLHLGTLTRLEEVHFLPEAEAEVEGS